MSRRISLLVFAASAALIASPAFADRECFENSCRLPGVVEPAPQPEQPAEAQAEAVPENEQPALARRPAPQGLVPSKPVVAAGRQQRDERNAEIAVDVQRAAGQRGAERPITVAQNQNTTIYRPNNTYVIYGAAYAVAPDAKIITLEPAD